MDPTSETQLAAPPDIPKKGRIVRYRLAEYDVRQIEERRKASNGLFSGNPVGIGDSFPFLITEDWRATTSGQAVNGQVMLDGNDSLWVTSRMLGDGPGTFYWPTRF